MNTLLLDFEEEPKEIKTNEVNLSYTHEMWQSVIENHEIADL